MGAEPKPPRVFIGPVEIAGYYSGLAEGLRRIGIDAVAVDASGHPFAYADRARLPWPARLGTLPSVRRARARPRSPWKLVWRILEVPARVWLFLWAARRFDAFVFGYGTSLLGGHDLPLLRRAGKRLIFAFNGSDARPSYVDGADMAPPLRRSIADAARMTREKKSRIRNIERYADAIVSQPAFSHFFERPVVDFFRIGHPWREAAEIADRTGPALVGSDRRTVILHSPSNPEVKGSERIRAVVDGLRADGYAIDLIELRGVPNDVVRDWIGRCDFVIDQIYSDAPMVGFATEAAVARRPAIVGGYAWPELEQIYEADAMPPVEACHPDALREAIIRLSTDIGYRSDLATRAHVFVRDRWALEAVARRYLALIRGEIEPGWLYDPQRLRYVRGVGLTEERARLLVQGILEYGGRGALQLSDKPDLEQAFVDFAGGA